MSTTLNDEHWLNLITQCRSSGLTDRQWCIENGIPVSTFYYHVRALRKKACEVPEAVDAAAQKQEVVQIPLWGKGTAFRYRSFPYALDLSGNAGHPYRDP